MSIVAIIPARSGSKGVPNKNINLLGDFPLISYSIAAGKLTPEIDRVIISTDSQEYADLAVSYGAEAPFLRPESISGDKSSDLDFVLHALQWFKDNEKEIPEYIVHLRPTTPLRVPEIMSEAIRLFLASPNASSLRSGHAASESPFKWFLKDEEGYFKGLRDDLTPEKVNLPRQMFPPVYIPDGYIDIIRSSSVLKTNSLHGNKMMVFESPLCHEVDTAEDFNYIEYQLQNQGTPLLNYLESIKR